MEYKEHECDEMPAALRIYQRFAYIGDKGMYLSLGCFAQPIGTDGIVMAGAAVSFPVRFCPFCGEELS